MTKNLVKLFCNVAIVFTIAITPLTFTSCRNPGDIVTTREETADQVILRAEQTAETALETFNLFVHIERDNEVSLKALNPKIHEYAEKIRRNGRGWIQSLRSSTKAFKANRNPENQATLQTWLKTVNDGLGQVNTYLEQAKPVTQP